MRGFATFPTPAATFFRAQLRTPRALRAWRHLSIGALHRHRFDGFSWRDALCAAGFDVWGLDFHGFGHADRYLEMEDPPTAHAALCRTDDASAQLETAVRFICHEAGATSLSIIAHSWGSMPTCRFAGRHPTQVDRLILFGPIARRPPRRYEVPPSAPAWRMVSAEDQWTRFVEDVPPGAQPVMSGAHFGAWAER